MKVLLAVGGGGHFSPALAVIESMPKEWEILLVGRKHAFEGDQALSLEYQTAHRLGLPFVSITTGRLQRKITKRSFISLFKMPVGVTQATMILKKFKPDVVVSFGGYVSVPVVLAAALLKVPIVIHEQTLDAGLANKIAARFATKICISWQQSAVFFPKNKTVLTGNPLRKEFLTPVIARRNDDTLIYITGGSGGAHGINVLIEGCLQKLLEKYSVIHQTGDAKEFEDFDRLVKLKQSLPENLQKRYLLKKFVEPEHVIEILTQADLIISRAGINTVTELLYFGKPSLLIPLPYGQQNEQLTNAQFMKQIGLAAILDQKTATAEDLLQTIATMISHLAAYDRYKKEAQQMIHLDAAEKIIEEVRYAKEARLSAETKTVS